LDSSPLSVRCLKDTQTLLRFRNFSFAPAAVFTERKPCGSLRNLFRRPIRAGNAPSSPRDRHRRASRRRSRCRRSGSARLGIAEAGGYIALGPRGSSRERKKKKNDELWETAPVCRHRCSGTGARGDARGLLCGVIAESVKSKRGGGGECSKAECERRTEDSD